MDDLDRIQLGIVRQNFPPSRRPDIPQTLAAEFQKAGFADRIKPGHRVLITSGSRGIESMLEVLQELVKLVRAAGGRPLILPAMGSHGGGTPEGQVDVLAHLGQTEETLGAPIHQDYRPLQVGEVFEGLPVFADRAATAEETDHVILVGRVKEHTEFSGPIESGLLKMAVVGLGRTAGATSMHQGAVKYTYSRTIQAMAEVLFQKLPVLGGVALVDDQRNILTRLEAIPAAEIPAREPELLAFSRTVKPQLPFDQLDILLVEEMGKDISGSGLDTKVIGRIMNIYEKEVTTPAVTRLITRRISEKGGGNAIGLGLSDFITKQLADQVDWDMTRLNSVVAISPEKGRCPIVAPTTREALKMALATVGPWRPESLALAWILNTKDLEYLAVTPALWDTIAPGSGLAPVSPPAALTWNAAGEPPHFTDYLSSRTNRE